MDTEAEAVDYDSMDHSEVNRVFVEDFLQEAQSRVPDTMSRTPWEVLDVGTGTALIPIELCRRNLTCRVIAVDLAEQMLKLAVRNIATAGYSPRIFPQRADSKKLPFADGSFDAVISNSILHHIPHPRIAAAEMLRVLRPGGLFFVRDLLRPRNTIEVDSMVMAYAGGANAHQQQMFRDSLHAALTLEEVRELLQSIGASPDWASQTSDRHWTSVGRRL
jgi:ubiquinone/menaquinone biosynthesis C-methylase UbiE